MEPVKVRFYEQAEDHLLQFAVIVAKADGRWVFCQHRERDTFEIPGGHREPGETILEAAQRELQEETGAVEYQIWPVCVYSVTGRTRVPESGDGECFGMLFAASITAFAPELHSEMARILLTDRLVDRWTYPLIQPLLIEEAQRRGYC